MLCCAAHSLPKPHSISHRSSVISQSLSQHDPQQPCHQPACRLWLSCSLSHPSWSPTVPSLPQAFNPSLQTSPVTSCTPPPHYIHTHTHYLPGDEKVNPMHSVRCVNGCVVRDVPVVAVLHVLHHAHNRKPITRATHSVRSGGVACLGFPVEADVRGAHLDLPESTCTLSPTQPAPTRVVALPGQC